MLKILLAALVMIGIALIVNQAVARAERVECLQWQRDAQTYRLYTSTNWQIAQCSAVGIPLTK